VAVGGRGRDKFLLARSLPVSGENGVKEGGSLVYKRNKRNVGDFSNAVSLRLSELPVPRGLWIGPAL